MKLLGESYEMIRKFLGTIGTTLGNLRKFPRKLFGKSHEIIRKLFENICNILTNYWEVLRKLWESV